MEFLKSTKTDLCQWLSSDAQYIIEKCEDILSVKQGKAVNQQVTDAEKIDMLLKTLMEMGNTKCEEFYEILKEEQKHYPGLQHHFNKNIHVTSSPTVYADCNSIVDKRMVTGVRVKNNLIMDATVQAGGMNPSEVNRCQPLRSADMVATNNSCILSSNVSYSTIDGDLVMSLKQDPPPKATQCPGPSVSKKIPVTDVSGFLKRNRTTLIDRVKNVKAILDEMQSAGYQTELAANVKAKPTTQEKMRELLDTVTSSAMMEALIQSLFVHQKDVMDELMEG